MTGVREGEVQSEFRRRLAALLPRLSRFAMALARSRADAEDLMQATCERAINRIDHWSPDTRLDSWMFRIMQTIWFNEVRARGVRRRHQEEMSTRPEPTSNGEGDAEMRLLIKQVEAQIAACPPSKGRCLRWSASKDSHTKRRLMYCRYRSAR